MSKFNQQIKIGVLWNLIGVLLSKGSTTIFTLFLARLLAPEAFGLIALAIVVFELANAFVDSGLGQALIQSRSISDIDLNTVFLANLLLSLGIYLILFGTAPLISDFYNQPELKILIQVMGIVVLINSTKIVQVAILSRAMNFKSQMKANTTASVASGVLGLFTAYSGFGVWSLVIMTIGQAFISSMLIWKSSHWRPGFSFSFESFLRLFRFGRNLLAEGLLSILFQNSYIIIIGKFFSAELTGLYFLAKKITYLVSTQLTGAVQQATFPALSTLQDNDEILKKKYRQILQIMMALLVPMMALMCAVALPIFGLVFDEEWRGAVVYLQLLCVVGALYPLHALNLNLLKVKGRSDLVFKIGIFKKIIGLILLICSIPFGVFGIVVGQICASVIALIPNTYFSARLIRYSLTDQLLDASKPLISGSLGGVVSWLFVGNNYTATIDQLFFGIIVGCMACLISGCILKEYACCLLVDKVSKSFLNSKADRDL